MKFEHLLFATVTILLLGGGYKLVKLERTQGRELRERAQRQQTQSWTIAAQRGDILDCQGRVLAGTRRAASVFMDPGLIEDAAAAADLTASIFNLDPAEIEREILAKRGSRCACVKSDISEKEQAEFARVQREHRLEAFETHQEPGCAASVFMDPVMVKNPAKTAALLAPIFGLDQAQFEKTIRELRGIRFAWIKRDVTDMELSDFNRARREYSLKAFGVRREPRRVYPYGRSAAQVIGFVGARQQGLAGIEQTYESMLTGVDGSRSTTVDIRGRRTHSEPDAYQPPIDGASVVLTIDAHLQQRAEHHLGKACEEFKPEWATAVVMDPLSGEVLAMAVTPDFDPAKPFPENLTDEMKKAAFDLQRNRAIADAYEPGSIFKPFIAGPALEAGITSLDESFAVNGPAHKFGSRIIHDVHPYGTLALYEVISKSSNIGMGMLGARCGNENLHSFVRSFGYGRKTGINLPGEHAGLLFSLKHWTKFSTQSIPIGQEIAVTSLQLVTAFSVFCNDGILYQPRIVRGVIDAHGETRVDNSSPVEILRVLSPETVREFRMRALVEVVNSGTGKPAQLAEYQVFGKTGTAQVGREDGKGYIPGAYVGSFLCGAPAESPRVVVLVSLFRPSSGKYYGSTVAAPAAAAIVADALDYMQVPPESPAVGSAAYQQRDISGRAW